LGKQEEKILERKPGFWKVHYNGAVTVLKCLMMTGASEIFFLLEKQQKFQELNM